MDRSAMDMLEVWTSMAHSASFSPERELHRLMNETRMKNARPSQEHRVGFFMMAKKKRTEKRQADDLSLIAGSFYIPICDPHKPQGEDAHFIHSYAQVIAVADGVSGWPSECTDSGNYARNLMKNVWELVNICGPRVDVGLKLILIEAFSRTIEKGSSTACILKLMNNTLRAVNLGDSGFVLIRKGKIFYKSLVQRHWFNHPYQLGWFSFVDRPEAANVIEMGVESGDVVVLGTDGLFDNIFDEEIAKLVEICLENGFAPELMAEVLAKLASRNSMIKDNVSPFEEAAHKVGLKHSGGKYNDVTVVASYISTKTQGK